jgi:hypothetical protein
MLTSVTDGETLRCRKKKKVCMFSDEGTNDGKLTDSAAKKSIRDGVFPDDDLMGRRTPLTPADADDLGSELSQLDQGGIWKGTFETDGTIAVNYLDMDTLFQLSWTSPLGLKTAARVVGGPRTSIEFFKLMIFASQKCPAVQIDYFATELVIREEEWWPSSIGDAIGRAEIVRNFRESIAALSCEDFLSCPHVFNQLLHPLVHPHQSFLTLKPGGLANSCLHIKSSSLRSEQIEEYNLVLHQYKSFLPVASDISLPTNLLCKSSGSGSGLSKEVCEIGL